MRYKIIYSYEADDDKILFETDNFDNAVKMIKSFARQYHLIPCNRNDVYEYCNFMNIPFNNKILIGYKANTVICEHLSLMDDGD